MSANSNASLRRLLDIPMTLDFNEFAALDSIGAADLAKIDGITNGTAAAGKALVLGASGEIATVTSATITTLTSTTVNATTLTAGTITGTAIGANSIVKSTANQSFTSGDTGTTLTNLTGLVQTVVPGTYKYRVFLPGVSTANSGMKVAFKLTTTVLTSIENLGKLFTASAVAVQHSTTTTDQTSYAAGTAANILVELEGTMVVGTGGTIQIQGAQNASHADTTTFYLGGTFELVRIA